MNLAQRQITGRISTVLLMTGNEQDEFHLITSILDRLAAGNGPYWRLTRWDSAASAKSSGDEATFSRVWRKAKYQEVAPGTDRCASQLKMSSTSDLASSTIRGVRLIGYAGKLCRFRKSLSNSSNGMPRSPFAMSSRASRIAVTSSSDARV